MQLTEQVKPNVGHSEGASGLTSVIKMVLALENKTVPPNINFLTPSPKSKFTRQLSWDSMLMLDQLVPFSSTGLHVPVEAVPWPKNRERVSVNSFGIGGANAHVRSCSCSILF